MPDYIIEPLDTDADVLYGQFVEFIQSYYPDWNPSEGQLDVIIGRYFSMQAAFTADMASRVQRAIYRYFGASLANIAPLPGAAATGIVNFTIDPPEPDVIYTLPYGTLVGITDTDGDLQMFSTLEDMVVPIGITDGVVGVQAIELGIAGNGLTGTVQLIELVDWISEAEVAGATTGGADPEEDDVYIQRLTDNLALMAPRPILAQDFAVMAQNVPGIWRAACIDNFRPGVLDSQVLHSNYTGGTFTLTYAGQTTIPIPATATAVQVGDALAGLTTLDATDVRVSGGPLPAANITATFIGRLAYQDIALLLSNTASLSGGTTFTITETAIGLPYGTDMENSIAISAIDIDGNPLSQSTIDDLMTYLGSSRPQNFVITWVDPAYNVVDIDYTAYVYKGQATDSVKTTIDGRLSEALSPKNWGTLPFAASDRDWVPNTMIRYLELTTIIENTPGVDYTSSLVFGVNGGAKTADNKSFPGSPFSLVKIGTINGTVLQ